MPEFTVYMREVHDVAVHVEANDYDAAIDQAHDEAPGPICAVCSGWGQKWSRDGGDDREVTTVMDADGHTVWPETAAALTGPVT
jgi:hypothetical protein